MDSQEETNIRGLETKVPVESLKAVSWAQVFSDGQHPKTCLKLLSQVDTSPKTNIMKIY